MSDMGALNIPLYDFLRKDLGLPEVRASELTRIIQEAAKEVHNDKMQELATKEFVKDEVRRLEGRMEGNKTELTRAIFWTNLVQFLAIAGAVMGIISFMLK